MQPRIDEVRKQTEAGRRALRRFEAAAERSIGASDPNAREHAVAEMDAAFEQLVRALEVVRRGVGDAVAPASGTIRRR